jgi:membrane protease YdiL (CAAX protease family)
MMNQINSTLNDHTSSFCHQIQRFVIRCSEESVKLVSAAIFVYLAGLAIAQLFSPAQRSRITARIWNSAIRIPMIEEMIFRLFSHALIYSAQCGYNKFLGREELTEEQKKGQKLFRIIVSASVFSLTHLVLNKGRRLYIHGPVTFLGGIAYGSLLEKYHTLSFGVLFHGINNLLTTTAAVFSPTILYPAILLNRCIAFYVTIYEGPGLPKWCLKG